MEYAERRVAPGLDAWTVSGGPREQRILPDGCLDLVWDGVELVVAGPDPTARLHTGDGGRARGLRFHGGRGAALLGVPADELTGRLVPLADVWGARRAGRLAARVGEDGFPAFEVEVEPFGDRLLALLGSGVDVATAASLLGWSSRQLQRRTRAAFGYGPAHLSRVLRLQRALALGDGGDPWASVATAAGYADQAHLARDVRALTGLTPTALRAERVRSVQDAA